MAVGHSIEAALVEILFGNVTAANLRRSSCSARIRARH